MIHADVKHMPAYDVIVVGGGVAGIAAAVASARTGAKTLLMEKSVILGGLATLGLISWYEPLCDGEGKQMIGGIPEELIRLSVRYGFGNLPEKWGGDGRCRSHYDRFATRFSPGIFALSLVEYLEQNGVALRLDTLATYPDMEDGLCRGVLVETVGGREFFPAKTVVDATGDACICHRAGMETELGENFFSYVTHEMTAEEAGELAAKGNFCDGRKWRGAGSDLAGNGHPKGMKTIRVTSADVVTDYMTRGARAVMERLKNTDKYSREILTVPGMPQFRKIRRIVGEYEFDGSEDGQRFENAIGSCGDFRKPGKHFQIPYTCLYHRSFGNLFAAGRIISATGDGWEITRVIPVAAMTGQAAGTAAALCARDGKSADTLEVSLLQQTLRYAGVLFE